MNTVKRPTDIYGTCERLSVNPILISTVAVMGNFAKLFSNENSKRLTTTQYRKEANVRANKRCCTTFRATITRVKMA